jgi:hypothetical protein
MIGDSAASTCPDPIPFSPALRHLQQTELAAAAAVAQLGSDRADKSLNLRAWVKPCADIARVWPDGVRRSQIKITANVNAFTYIARLDQLNSDVQAHTAMV